MAIKKTTRKRPCKRCDKIFEAVSKYNWICQRCKKKSGGSYKSKIYQRMLERENIEGRSKNGNNRKNPKTN